MSHLEVEPADRTIAQFADEMRIIPKGVLIFGKDKTGSGMAKELFNRYVWLIDMLQRYGRLTRREIDELWLRSEYSEGKPMARRTFMNYRQAIQEMFDVNIECDPSTYEYYIEDPEALEGNGARVWALNTLAVNSLLNESQELRERIVLENIPSGQKFLRIVFEAMKENRVMSLSYRSFRRATGSHALVAPYFVKLFRQRWYVVGLHIEEHKIKTYALDRVTSLELGDRTFVYPEGFEPADYFKDCFGITYGEQPAQEVVLRVPALQANYLRTLPLHESQVESERSESHSIFRYRLKITPDLVQEVYALGFWQAEVLAPQSLREAVAVRLAESLSCYGPKG